MGVESRGSGSHMTVFMRLGMYYTKFHGRQSRATVTPLFLGGRVGKAGEHGVDRDEMEYWECFCMGLDHCDHSVHVAVSGSSIGGWVVQLHNGVVGA